MKFLDLLLNKRNGLSHTPAELDMIVKASVADEIPDYQLAAWLMAVYFQGMTLEETTALTLAMANSGDIIDLSSIPGIKVDKHSTGGVADTVTLILAPLIAAAGVPVAKMSGRGLGFTGGTIDKLESIPGFQTSLRSNQFLYNLLHHGIALTCQSERIAPADGKFYALRDVTGTVESIPLIASSIMSKKIASGADKIILDVKVGRGAFMKNIADATALAETMVQIGTQVGRETVAVLTNMDIPLGQAIGNSLEVAEAIEILHGQGSKRLRQAVLVLGSYMLLLTKHAPNVTSAERQLARLLDSGSALAKFKEWVTAQGGNVKIAEYPELLQCAPVITEVHSPQAGYLLSLDALALGTLAMKLGAGREQKGQIINPAVGIRLQVSQGDLIQMGQIVALLHTTTVVQAQWAETPLLAAFTFTDKPPTSAPLVLAIIKKN
jgi:pyrimidine-nucleoside phosphorylase